MSTLRRFFVVFALIFAPAASWSEESTTTMADQIDSALAPVTEIAGRIVFWGIPVGNGLTLPLVLVALGVTAIFLTVYFKFINLRGFGIALRTAKSKYTNPDAPGQITHFQALSAALSATVGLGNIAGVAVAIGLGGPGATFWMIFMGLCGMTTKFAECTLGVKYRRIDSSGKVHGGAMYYLKHGLSERGMGGIGGFLAILFAIFVIGGAFGAGNMFQANQAFSQFSGTFLPEGMAGGNSPIVFGAILAVLVGLVIIGGIVSIARVTSFLVPFMCGIYVAAALVIIFVHIDQVLPAIGLIVKSAFTAEAAAGGFIGGLIQGIKRAAFSNEAGFGSAPIAHSAVKTDKPASEGFVALLEPFIDTVVVCTMTALVIIITGTWQVSATVTGENVPVFKSPAATEKLHEIEKGQFVHTRESKGDYLEVIGLVSAEDRDATDINGWIRADSLENMGGVTVTSMAFESVISWFPDILAIAVILFAFSTMISWSYYGEQGVTYLFSGLGEKGTNIAVLIYKLVFCLLIIVGSSATLGNVINLSDALVFAMVAPNLIGLYLLLPVIKREAESYIAHTKEVDGKK